MLTKFYSGWYTVRAYLFAAVIVALLVCSIKGHPWGLEVEDVSPGTEADQLRRDYEDRENRDAYDRMQNGSDDPKDWDKGTQWERDHCV